MNTFIDSMEITFIETICVLKVMHMYKCEAGTAGLVSVA